MLQVIAATLLLFATVVDPATALRDIRVLHIAPAAPDDARLEKLRQCLGDKLTEGGRFSVAPTPDAADAILHISATIPSGGTRVLWGRSPEVRARVLSRTGVRIWSGSNKYKKGTTAWGAGTDMECGLANGLARKLTGER